MTKNSKAIQKSILKKRGTTPTKPPEDPPGSLLYERITVQTIKGCRGLITRVLRDLLNGLLPESRARTALPWVYAAMSCNHALQLVERLDLISTYLQLPEKEDTEDPAEKENFPDANPAGDPEEE